MKSADMYMELDGSVLSLAGLDAEERRFLGRIGEMLYFDF
jgi:hypothetical protein